MNSTKLKQASFLLALTLGFTTLPASSTKAATIFWDMSLFDDAGTQVGDGEFSYDPETVDTLSFPDTAQGGIDVTTDGLLDSLTVNIFGEELISEPAGAYSQFSWWNTNSNAAMQSIIDVFAVGTVLTDNWYSNDFTLDFRGSSQAFSLDGISTSTTGQGEWRLNGSGVASAGNPPGPSPLPDSITSILQGRTITGSWTASLREDNSVDPDSDSATTPESSSIFTLVGFGLLGLSLAKKKHYLQNRN